MNSTVSQVKKDRFKSIALLALVAVLWSLGGLFIKLIQWNAVAIAGVRSVIASLVILAVIKKPNLKWDKFKFAGAVAYAGTVILFVIANKLTTAATAILLQYTAPVYVALFGAWFLKEKTSLLDWASIFLVLGGMVLFFIDKMSTGGLIGNICAILSGFSFACLVLLLRKQKDESPLESVFWGNVLTALIGLPFMFSSMPDLKGWGGLLILGIFQLGLAYILYTVAIKNVTALEAILIPVLEPILNPVWVFIFMGEMPGPWALVGGFIVLVSITGRTVIAELRTKYNKENNEAM
ncbi:MAG: DMT family transporter [Caulobacteraceae bacterium]